MFCEPRHGQRPIFQFLTIKKKSSPEDFFKSLILERKEGGRAGDRNCNLGMLGMCPDGESNPKIFGVWDYAPTEPPSQGS